MANKIVFTFIAQDKFNRVAREMQRRVSGLRSGFSGMSDKIRQARGNLDKFSQKLKQSGTTLKEWGAKAAIGVVTPLVLMGNYLTNVAKDAAETRSKFDTVFKSMTANANTAADNLAKNYGLSGAAARQLMGDTGDLLTGFGFTQKSALNLSSRVNELAVDLASFTNYSGGAEGASHALNSALLGERDALKSLGIAISEDNVKKEVALLIAQGRHFATMRQAKAEATLSLAIKQSKNAIGDFARTQSSLANQERVLAARTADAAEKFGKLLIPIKLFVVTYVGKLLTWLSGLSGNTRKWVLGIGGAILAIGSLLVVLGSLAVILPIVASGAALLLSPFLLIPAAIAAIVAGGVYLYRNFSLVRKVVDAVAHAITVVFNAAVENVSRAVELITGVFTKAQEFGQKIGEKVLFVKQTLGFDTAPVVTNRSQTDVNVNLKGPQGAVESTKTTTRGNVPGMNVGVNMAMTGP